MTTAMLPALPPLGDLSQYIDPDNPININNTAVVIIKDKDTKNSTERNQIIRCSGLILSLRSPVFKDILLKDDEIYLTDFHYDYIEYVFQCLKLLYGGQITLTDKNVFAVYKFGFIYKIEDMTNIVFGWLKDNLPPSSFWDMLFKFQLYQSEKSIPTFTSIANKFLEINSPDFTKTTLGMLTSSNDLEEKKYVTRFMFSQTNSGYLGINLKIFQQYIVHYVTNDQTELCAEVFLNCIDDKLDVIPKDKSDEQLLFRIFESLQKLLSTVPNLRKLSSIQMKLLSKHSVNPPTETPKSNLASAKPLALGPSFNPWRIHENANSSSNTIANVDNNYPISSCQTLSSLINELTSDSTDELKIADFCRNSEIPPYMIIEIGLGWITKNPTNQTNSILYGIIKYLAKQAEKLPYKYYQQTILRTLYEHNKEITPPPNPANFDDTKYQFTSRELSGYRIKQLSTGRTMTFLEPCAVPECPHEGNQTFKFRYNNMELPEFESNSNIGYNSCVHYHKEFIKHWIMIYKIADDVHFFSFLTGLDDCGFSFNHIMESIKRNKSTTTVWLSWLFRKDIPFPTPTLPPLDD